MKKDDVKVDGTYWAKVSGGVVPVRITGEKWTGSKHTGWVGVNTTTNRGVRIKSAARLRAEVKDGGEGGEAPAEQEATGGATLPHDAEGAVTASAGSPKPPSGKGAKRGAKAAKATAKRSAGATTTTVTKTKAKTPKAPKPAKAPKAAKEPKEPAPAKPRKTSALDAAAQVLAAAGTPMKAKEMVAQMEAKGLWTSPGGKTPEATLYAAIIREIAAKGKEARFRKTERGTFVSAGAASAGKGG